MKIFPLKQNSPCNLDKIFWNIQIYPMKKKTCIKIANLKILSEKIQILYNTYSLSVYLR